MCLTQFFQNGGRTQHLTVQNRQHVCHFDQHEVAQRRGIRNNDYLSWRFSLSAGLRLTLLPQALSQRRLAFEILRIVKKDAVRLQKAVESVAAQPKQLRGLMVGQSMRPATFRHQGRLFARCRAHW